VCATFVLLEKLISKVSNLVQRCHSFPLYYVVGSNSSYFHDTAVLGPFRLVIFSPYHSPCWRVQRSVRKRKVSRSFECCEIRTLRKCVSLFCRSVDCSHTPSHCIPFVLHHRFQRQETQLSAKCQAFTEILFNVYCRRGFAVEQALSLDGQS